MSKPKDDPNKRGPQDRNKVSNQDHEVQYTTNDLDITKEQLKDIKKDVGVSRVKIEDGAKMRNQK